MIATANETKRRLPSSQPGITIENIGPIEHLELDAKPGTITVLRGQNGKGKSTALDAISALTRGNGGLESRDGTVGGQASGFGVSIKVGRGGQNRRTGELEVVAVEDKLSIADFVDPPVKDPVAADSRRLKALVSLVGLVAQPDLFHAICGGKEQFDSLVKPETLKSTDPIELAERIKRDLEAASRIATTRAERLFGEMQAKHASIDGLDLKAEHNGDVLQRQYDAALSALSALEERQRSAASIVTRRQQAQVSLDNAAASYNGPTVQQARAAVDQAIAAKETAWNAVQQQQAVVDQIKQQLQAAEITLNDKQAEWMSRGKDISAARDTLVSCERHNMTIATWQQTLEEDAVTNAPTGEAIEHARGVVKVARLANETGVLIRSGLQRQAEAESLDAERKAAVKQSESLREAAKSVLDVLAAGVKSLVPGLVIDNQFRIRVPHAVRTECYYSELSHGERWKLALDIAVAAFTRKGEPGVLAIPQEAWEGLDGRNRRLIADHVAETDLIVFTAEAERSLGENANALSVEVLA